MNLEEALTISKIDLNNINFSKVRQTRNKKIILIKYGKNKSNFVFQTPSLDLVSKQDSSIEISLSGKEKVKVNAFNTFLSNLENKLKSEAQKNYNEWFDVNNDTINFQKLVRESNQFNNGTMKFKILDTPEFKTELRGNLDNSSRVWVKLILELYAVWVNNNNNFGVYFRPILISFDNKKKYNYKFAESDSEDENVDIPDTEIQYQVNNNIFVNSNVQTTDIETLVNHLELVSSISSLMSDKDNKHDENKNDTSSLDSSDSSDRLDRLDRSDDYKSSS